MGRRTYKFTDKKHTRQGMASAILGVLALLLLLASLWMAYQSSGKAGKAVGLLGLLSLAGSAAGFWLGVRGFREEDAYYLFSRIGVVMNSVLFILWMLIFVLGM